MPLYEVKKAVDANAPMDAAIRFIERYLQTQKGFVLRRWKNILTRRDGVYKEIQGLYNAVKEKVLKSRDFEPDGDFKCKAKDQEPLMRDIEVSGLSHTPRVPYEEAADNNDEFREVVEATDKKNAHMA